MPRAWASGPPTIGAVLASTLPTRRLRGIRRRSRIDTARGLAAMAWTRPMLPSSTCRRWRPRRRKPSESGRGTEARTWPVAANVSSRNPQAFMLLRACRCAIFERPPGVVPRWNWFREIVPDVTAGWKRWSPRRQRAWRPGRVGQRLAAASLKRFTEGAASRGRRKPHVHLQATG